MLVNVLISPQTPLTTAPYKKGVKSVTGVNPLRTRGPWRFWVGRHHGLSLSTKVKWRWLGITEIRPILASESRLWGQECTRIVCDWSFVADPALGAYDASPDSSVSHGRGKL